jgi:hypothetical protein
MPADPLVPETTLQRLLPEQAIAFAKELESTAQDAPPGLLLARCENVAVAQGRLFLRNALAAALQQQIDDGEKRGRPREPVPADTPGGTRVTPPAPSSPPSAPST